MAKVNWNDPDAKRLLVLIARRRTVDREGARLEREILRQVANINKKINKKTAVKRARRA